MCRILSILSSTLAVGGLSSLVCPPLLSHLIMSSLLWVPCRPSSWIQCMQPPVGCVSHNIIISGPQSRAPFNTLLWLPTCRVAPPVKKRLCSVHVLCGPSSAQTHYCGTLQSYLIFVTNITNAMRYAETNLSCGEISDFYAWQMWKILKYLHVWSNLHLSTWQMWRNLNFSTCGVISDFSV